MIFYIVMKEASKQYLNDTYSWSTNPVYMLLHSDYAIAALNASMYGGTVKRVTLTIDNPS